MRRCANLLVLVGLCLASCGDDDSGSTAEAENIVDSGVEDSDESESSDEEDEDVTEEETDAESDETEDEEPPEDTGDEQRPEDDPDAGAETDPEPPGEGDASVAQEDAAAEPAPEADAAAPAPPVAVADAGDSADSGSVAEPTPQVCPSDDLDAAECQAAIGEDVAADLAVRAGGNETCQVLELSVGVSYSLLFERTDGPPGAPLEYELASSAGDILAEGSALNSVAFYHEFSVEEDQAATLCASTTSSDAALSFRFRVDPDWANGLVQDETTFEPNYTLGTSREIVIGQDVVSTLTEERSDWRDCYRFSAVSGVDYSLFMERTAGPAGIGDSLTYEVISETGYEFVNNGSANSEGAHYHMVSASYSETVFVCIATPNHTDFFEYRFRIDLDWDNGLVHDEETYEPNYTIGTAYTVELGQELSSSLTAEREDWQDCYRVALEAATQYSLAVERLSGPEGGELYYSLVTSAGEQLASDTFQSDGISAFDVTPTYAGSAYLCLYANEDEEVFEYTFSIQ